MWSLILKIFLCYWIAASMVIAAIDIGPRRQMRRPEASEALASALRLHARSLLDVYEAGGCASAEPLMAEDSGDTMSLALPNGEVLCPPRGVAGVGSLVKRASSSRLPVAVNYPKFQVVALAVSSASGKRYVVLLKSRFTTPDSFGLMPDTTTIAISGVLTLLLTILIALPIRKLRRAAREIAGGQLDARVAWGRGSGWIADLPPSDVLHSLMLDFNRMAARLQSLVADQRILIRDVSHELRSPLARLSVALELAREAGPASMKAPLDRMEAEAGRVNGLISQLLSLSYMESVQELSCSTDLSLSDLVASMMPDIQYEAKSRRCHVIARTIHDCTVRGDPGLLQSAIENVARNAVRYTPENGVVQIEVAKIECDGIHLAVLRVGDDGPGVPSEELESILRPFYRVDKSRQRSTGGFGVGLAIADRVVQLHAGEIKASNKPHGGLLVEMTFPLCS